MVEVGSKPDKEILSTTWNFRSKLCDTHHEIRSTDAPLRRTILASNAGAKGEESAGSRGVWSSSSSSNNLRSMRVRSLGAHSERWYSPGR